MRVFTTTAAEAIQTVEPLIPPVAQAAPPKPQRVEDGVKQPDDPNKKSDAQIARDQQPDKPQPDRAVAAPAAPEFKNLIFTTQYGVRHQVPVEDLQFHSSVADRKPPEGVEQQDPWQKVQPGDFLVTHYDVADDKTVHRVYAGDMFEQLFRPALN